MVVQKEEEDLLHIVDPPSTDRLHPRIRRRDDKGSQRDRCAKCTHTTRAHLSTPARPTQLPSALCTAGSRQPHTACATQTRRAQPLRHLCPSHVAPGEGVVASMLQRAGLATEAPCALLHPPPTRNVQLAHGRAAPGAMGPPLPRQLHIRIPRRRHPRRRSWIVRLPKSPTRKWLTSSLPQRKTRRQAHALRCCSRRAQACGGSSSRGLRQR